ncbi:hypothetical protein M3Y96_00795100 [Aphelenchoides besseyi]|nr:hypothetical protein M3Y96_00795100 [Aphelenchoides besseyi]
MLVYRKQTNDETKLPLFGVAAAYKWAFLNETTCEKRNIIDGNKEIAQLRAAQYNYPSTVVTLTSTSSRPSSPSNSVFIFVVVFLLLLSLLLNLFFIVKFFKFTERFRIQYFRDTVNFIRFD